MTKVRGEGFSVRFTRRPVTRKKSEAAFMNQPVIMIQPVQKPASDFRRHFTQVADRVERGFTFALKLKPKTVDPIFRELSQMAKAAYESKKITPEQRLLAAAQSGDCPTIRKLVMQGVDLEARDGQGRTAMNIATQFGKQEVVATILAAKEMRYMATLGELPATAFYKRFQRGTGTSG